MNSESTVPPNDQKELKNQLSEVSNLEKQLWALIHSKGLLQVDVQELYHKACSGYEKIILNDHRLSELQDIEYSLWKLHYKHIDEFRKRIRINSASGDSKNSPTLQNLADGQKDIDRHREGFKSFLTEATQFYQHLVIKLKRCYGLPEESLFYGSGGAFCFSEPTKMHKCQFLCHRFLICLGDLSRYRELCEKTESRKHNWSIAVTYYLNASMTWPASGNPQNQLAVLATYIGDEFLALYHCVRSLAVREPFPDAWDNLMLLFEKNQSSWLRSLSSKAQFDFFNPSQRSVLQNKLQPSDGLSSCKAVEPNEHIQSDETELWSLFIRMISFFFTQSSLDDFPCTFAATMAEFEVLLELDDTKLEVALESYQHMDSARTGPYKALQVVSALIFVIQNLIESTELKKLKTENGMERDVLTQLALTATFICIGRFVDRCLKCNPIDCCPLLPALLVFVEWLVGMLDKVDTYKADEKSIIAISYFFGAFVELLNQFGEKRCEVRSPNRTALWEDYELLGFAPMADAHASLNFSTHWEHVKSHENRKECRAHWIIDAGTKIANRPNTLRKWIIWDESKRKFCMAKSKEIPEKRESEVALFSSNLDVEEQFYISRKECAEQVLEEVNSSPSLLSKSVALEEEEVILFKPITRFNSVPLPASITSNNQTSLAGIDNQLDECLRRASSVLVAQKQARSDPFAFHSTVTNVIGDKPMNFKQQELIELVHPSSSETCIAAGPPSLSAWVLNRGSLSFERERGARDDFSHSSTSGPDEEIACASLSGLSIRETDSVIGSGNVSATTHYPPYSTPVPSAPLIPDDAVWFNETNNVSVAPQLLGGYCNWTPTDRPLGSGPSDPGSMDGYPVSNGMASSSEWLRQHTDYHNLSRANSSHILPLDFYAPTNFSNFYGYDASRFDLFDRWGNPLAPNSMIYLEKPPLNAGFLPPYGVDEQRREKLFHNYHRPSPLGRGAMADTMGEQQPLLQCLKAKEWQLQQNSQVRNPTYMGN